MLKVLTTHLNVFQAGNAFDDWSHILTQGFRVNGSTRSVGTTQMGDFLGSTYSLNYSGVL